MPEGSVADSPEKKLLCQQTSQAEQVIGHGVMPEPLAAIR